jgi:hypothetical protein
MNIWKVARECKYDLFVILIDLLDSFIFIATSTTFSATSLGSDVGEFRKTRHPRNVKSDKVLETCFSGAGNSRFSEAWDLRILEFANV